MCSFVRHLPSYHAHGLEGEAQMDDAIDRWNDGALDALRGRKALSDNPDYLEGYAHGLDQRKVRAVMPARPEGYYHAPLGTFD